MGNRFASSRNALGICDRCGLSFKLRTLSNQVINQKPSGLLVCKECLDVDHPQLQLGKYPVHDPQALRNPRPDINPGR